MFLEVGGAAEDEAQAPQPCSVGRDALKIRAGDTSRNAKSGPKLRRSVKLLPKLPHCRTSVMNPKKSITKPNLKFVSADLSGSIRDKALNIFVLLTNTAIELAFASTQRRPNVRQS